jgi:tetratricopeptide (TPR) repeat protein
MRKITRLIASALATAMLAACAEGGDEGAGSTQAGLDDVTSAIMDLPVTTASEGARTDFLRAQYLLDVGRFLRANEIYQRAVTKDPTFALAYLNVANTANSLDEFTTNLAMAEQHAAQASEEERLQIEIARKGFANDVEGQLAAALRLTELQPQSPRAWLALSGLQVAGDQVAEGRASLARALELGPQLIAAHTQAGNSYMFDEPQDYAQALQHMQHAVRLAPNEPYLHDLTGDAYRALNDLENARAEYTRGHELDATDAGLIQQRGHVNSFLGDYAAARADYDSSIALSKVNQAANFAPYRALVSVHEGNPAAAITELQTLVTNIDGMDVPEPRGLKVNALTFIADIAIHTGDVETARTTLTDRAALMMEQADAAGTEQFRRAQAADTTYYAARLATAAGDFASAQTLLTEYGRLVEPDANPRKMERAHEVMGHIALAQDKYAEAVQHYQQANPYDTYTQYHLALALEGAGNTEEAHNLFSEISTYNFNSQGFALIRRDALAKAAM